MAALNAAKVIRRVRTRLQLSQEGLSRILNATKGAIQHWERGRNNPDLARLLALRELCPPGAERKELDGLIRQTQAQVSPLLAGNAVLKIPGGIKGARLAASQWGNQGLTLLRRENARLHRQVTRLEADAKKREEQCRALSELVKDQEREKAELRAKLTGGAPVAEGTPAT
ncbi:MAG TPA: helix-turn-helix domain-containing protein [Terriglobia bacterium]|nr:helix-turn-helix domain-containing protein [Terriglobia bacterium]